MNISNIDDLLMGKGNSQQPATPEHKEKLEEKKPSPQEDGEDLPEYDDNDEGSEDLAEEPEAEEETDEETEGKPEGKTAGKEEESDDDGLDEYGNQKEQEVAQRDHEIAQLRAQLAQQGASREVQQAVKDFKYNPDEEVSWEQQLSEFVKQTVTNMHRDEQKVVRERQERDAQEKFEKNFRQGMERFGDFRETVGKYQIDDAMTLSLRGMSDPSAFIYAACKRQPQELERIAKLPDPYARMVEMGKLEEKMRRTKAATKAPRPLGRTREDAVAKTVPKQKDTTGDDLLAKADAKRLATVRNRHKSNR